MTSWPREGCWTKLCHNEAWWQQLAVPPFVFPPVHYHNQCSLSLPPFTLILSSSFSSLCLRWKLWLKKALNNTICSCCIRMWYSALLTIVWVSQPCHKPLCWSLRGCKTKPWNSFWKWQKTHPLRLCSACWTCHQWKQDKVEQVKANLNDVWIPHVLGLEEFKQVRDRQKRPVWVQAIFIG